MYKECLVTLIVNNEKVCTSAYKPSQMHLAQLIIKQYLEDNKTFTVTFE